MTNDDDTPKANNTANNAVTDPMAKSLGMSPIIGNLLTNSGKLIMPEDQGDYEHSRQHMLDLIEKGNLMFSEFAQIAASAQSPRHYEVLTNMFNSLLDANKKLLELRQQEIDIKRAQVKPTDGDKTVNNNLFVGSTSELQKMIENMNKK